MLFPFGCAGCIGVPEPDGPAVAGGNGCCCAVVTCATCGCHACDRLTGGGGIGTCTIPGILRVEGCGRNHLLLLAETLVPRPEGVTLVFAVVAPVVTTVVGGWDVGTVVDAVVAIVFNVVPLFYVLNVILLILRMANN